MSGADCVLCWMPMIILVSILLISIAFIFNNVKVLGLKNVNTKLDIDNRMKRSKIFFIIVLILLGLFSTTLIIEYVSIRFSILIDFGFCVTGYQLPLLGLISLFNLYVVYYHYWLDKLPIYQSLEITRTIKLRYYLVFGITLFLILEYICFTYILYEYYMALHY
jgi:hypothetical protein